MFKSRHLAPVLLGRSQFFYYWVWGSGYHIIMEINIFQNWTTDRVSKILNGLHSQGYLDFIERQSVAGHVLTIIDENQQKLTDKCSVWINGHYYRVSNLFGSVLSR